jgi:hypothetical protein
VNLIFVNAFVYRSVCILRILVALSSAFAAFAFWPFEYFAEGRRFL